MKKIVSFILICCMLMGTFTACGNMTGSGENQNTEDAFVPVLRFAAASDIHIISTDCDNTQKTATFIQQMNQLVKDENANDGYAFLDAIVFAGDITDAGTVEQFQAAHNVITSNMMEETELVITMGNHDWYSLDQNSRTEFEKVFGTALSDKVVKGFHFITIVNDGDTGWAYSKQTREAAGQMMQEAVEDTGKEKPVFVVQHIGNLGTVAGTCQHLDDKQNTAVTTLAEIEGNYSNLVVFSGHSHFPTNDECSIHQKSFTAINTGSLYYGRQSLYDNEWVEIQNKKGLCQAQVVEVDAKGRMRVRCWDVSQGRFVGEPWMVTSWKTEDFVYTEDRFSQDQLFFAEDAQLTVMPTLLSVTVSFPSVPKESLPARVYEVSIADLEGNVVSTNYLGVDYFYDDFSTPIMLTVKNLEAATEYVVNVRAVNSLYCSEIHAEGTLYSQALTATFKTKG